jgi:signal transduction histidine kinase
MMSVQSKTKVELIKELLELQLENNSLKALYDKDITVRKKAKQALIIANKELVFQNQEKEKRAAELGIANIELAFQDEEKGKRAAELGIANIELAFQKEEKGKRAAELGIANLELAFQDEEKGKRAAELGIANIELAFQDKEKGKRAAELGIANLELVFQKKEKGKRAAELIIANKELVFQNEEKEKRAAELMIANKELVFQNQEKEKRAAELMIANKELAFQNREKEKRAAELIIANKELESFSYSVSHDLRAPLRHISGFVDLLLNRFKDLLPDKARHYLDNIADSSRQMDTLINDLLQFSRTGRQEMREADIDMNRIVQDVLNPIKQDNQEKIIEWHIATLPHVYGDQAMLRLVWVNLLGNAVKFTRYKDISVIEINVRNEKNEFIFSIRDNGVGFDMKYAQKLFGVFQRLHVVDEFEGTGIGLANVHQIIVKHGGRTWAEAEPDKGATFYFSLPINKAMNNG